MNDDRFMHSLRREPLPEFARGLWNRLAPRETADETEPAPRRLVPVLASAFAAIAIVALFVFPSVRASAQAFLDLFRVHNFVAVNVDPARFERLKGTSLDLKELVGSRMQVLQEPGAPRPYPSVSAAGAAAGVVARTPAWMPAGLGPDSVWVAGEGRVRVTADGARLRSLMDVLEVRDLSVPPGLDGATVEVHAWPAVRQTWRRSGDTKGPRALLIQARSPEVSLPAGLELARLAEIGLRLLGMPEADARRLADRTDWRTTLVVPVPMNSASFQEVDVDGTRGLLITPRQGQERTLLMWSRNGEVFALAGKLPREELLQMAGSLR